MRKLARFFVLIFVGAPLALAQLTVHYINVGQAAAALVDFKTGAILIDAGGEDTGDDTYGDHLLEYLNHFFENNPGLNRTLDAVLISHAHLDHTMNLMEVMENFSVKTLVDTGEDSGSGIVPLKKARQFADRHGINYISVSNSGITKNGRVLKLLSGNPGDSASKITALSGSRDCANNNNDSITLHIEKGQASLLFAGDAENEPDSQCDAEIGMLLQRFVGTTVLASSVLHVPHHGSYNGTSADFMAKVAPQISIISAGNPDRKSPLDYSTPSNMDIRGQSR